MNNITVCITAHVDAGKTTLAEAILYKTGIIRRLGKVDNGDTVLDSDELERKRGITIFSGESHFSINDKNFTLLDTPGHVDFSAETERVFSVSDYAILVISGIEPIQSHTVTLWNLLKLYNIPTVIFVTKTDFGRYSNEYIIRELKKEFDNNFIDFSTDEFIFSEETALCRDDITEKYLDTGKIDIADIKSLIKSRYVFPVFFGSGLKIEGIDDFLNKISVYFESDNYSENFGAKVYKISHDNNGAKITHLKITGGELKVKDSICYKNITEKINSIRVNNGNKFITVDKVYAGDICTVTGLTETTDGDNLGNEYGSNLFYTEPVMNYKISLPDDVDIKTFLPKLKILEEEEPLLNVCYNSQSGQINVNLMGEIQVEILKSIISNRFNIDVNITDGKVMYKETVINEIEGVGHYEPLRHYAECHILITPLPVGTGIKYDSKCREDVLDKNLQRLILSHLTEKQHIGVLTGSPLTDVKYTLVAGRAHIKHTEGGDFRQATYRAVRQGLMSTECKLLEPYYNFKITVPSQYLGRVISDIKLMSGEFRNTEEYNGYSVIVGKSPVVTINSYANQIASFTSGKGKIQLSFAGYFNCHNEKQVIEEYNYNPENDLENTADSIFCAHGAGFTVKWNKVYDYMHIESYYSKNTNEYTAVEQRRNFHIDDKELERIMEKEFGKAKTTQTLYTHTINPKSGKDENINLNIRKKYIIVDGYNCIFAFDELKKISKYSLEQARIQLADILCNFAAYTKNEIILVFDAYLVKGNKGENSDYKNIHIVYTKENELADVYIEKLVREIGKNSNVRVVSSDGLIQLSTVRFGVLRTSSREFYEELKNTNEEIRKLINELNNR